MHENIDGLARTYVKARKNLSNKDKKRFFEQKGLNQW